MSGTRRRRVLLVVVVVLVVGLVAAGVAFWWVVIRDTRPRFAVDEVDDGLKVEWVSTDVLDTLFETTYRLTNTTGEDVWLGGSRGIVSDRSRGGYAFAAAFVPPDPDVDYYVEPASGVSVLGAGESRYLNISVALPFSLMPQMEDDDSDVYVDPSSLRICVGYIPDSELPEGMPEKGLSLGYPDMLAIYDWTGFRLQHVSCSEPFDLN
ncbi:hypothetical protein [Actinobaculum sp. 352]|uniref:hypothetical protein n=1 Tax=Actinobaculum sp. 352 TaxID=2490946 RepID=UPI000F7F483F|nr:hypothetical protein [Actinobaculum sp. 352]RTE50329.1 hypothetical protein EKN07_03775 [Actinobaculum sp. 352]